MDRRVTLGLVCGALMLGATACQLVEESSSVQATATSRLPSTSDLMNMGNIRRGELILSASQRIIQAVDGQQLGTDAISEAEQAKMSFYTQEFIEGIRQRRASLTPTQLDHSVRGAMIQYLGSEITWDNSRDDTINQTRFVRTLVCARAIMDQVESHSQRIASVSPVEATALLQRTYQEAKELARTGVDLKKC